MFELSTEDRIAIIGLGYVGLPLAVEFGKQCPTIGFDIDQARVAELQGGHDRTLEVTREEMAVATQLQYSSTVTDLAECRVFIVTVPTPINRHKQTGSHPADSCQRDDRLDHETGQCRDL